MSPMHNQGTSSWINLFTHRPRLLVPGLQIVWLALFHGPAKFPPIFWPHSFASPHELSRSTPEFIAARSKPDLIPSNPAFSFVAHPSLLASIISPFARGVDN